MDCGCEIESKTQKKKKDVCHDHYAIIVILQDET